MDRHRVVPLLALLAVAGLIVLWLYPPESSEKGVAIAGWTVCDLAHTETVERPFTLEYAFDRISLSYDIDEARHIHTSFTDPTGHIHEAVATTDALGRDVLDLEVQGPPLGKWTWRLTADEGEQGPGHLTQGDFIILGFGVAEAEIEPSVATGGVMPSGTCSA